MSGSTVGTLPARAAGAKGGCAPRDPPPPESRCIPRARNCRAPERPGPPDGRRSRSDSVRAMDALAAYARLVVRVGVNLQPGQEVLLGGQVEQAPFVRAIAEEAYRA